MAVPLELKQTVQETIDISTSEGKFVPGWSKIKKILKKDTRHHNLTTSAPLYTQCVVRRMSHWVWRGAGAVI